MSWTWISDTVVRARKIHRCVGCYEIIDLGQPHLARRGINENGFVTDRWHFECEEYAFLDGDYECSPGSFTRQEALQHASSCDDDRRGKVDC